VFALSAVQFASGFCADLARFGRFCGERGIFFVVDAIQALGQVEIDVREARIDVLATGGHKWLCAPFGTGFAYVRRELQDRLRPHLVGWTGMQACTDYTRLLDYQYEFLPDARRFEPATHGLQDFVGLAESIEFLLDVGVRHIGVHQQEVLRPLLDWLAEHPEVTVVSDLAPARRTGIFCFQPRDPEATFRAVTDAGVVCVLREGAIRIAPHLYNTVDDVARLVGVLNRSPV
jgi:selenocysteine lyase/cysteine desulfurase